MFIKNINDINRQAWLKQTLAILPIGTRLLGYGAAEFGSVCCKKTLNTPRQLEVPCG